MRVLVLHNRYKQRGGEDAVVDAEVDLLRSLEHEVFLETVDNDDIAGIFPRAHTFLRAPFDPQQAKRIARVVRQLGIDVVHVHNFFPLLTPAVHYGASRAGAAVVQTLHNYRLLCASALLLRDGAVCEKCLGGSNVWGVVHRCYRRSLLGSLALVRMQRATRRTQLWDKYVHRFVALTEFSREKFVEGGLPPARIVVKPNFVSDIMQNERAARKGVLYVGRLSKEKGIDVLLQSWMAIPDELLTIVGDGPERARLEALAPRGVRFMGQLDQAAVRHAMATAACLVVPSVWYEGLPVTVLEAFAMGLPVLASDIGSLSEVVTDGYNGHLFKPGNSDDLKSVIREFFGKSDRVAMSIAARKTYLRKYTPSENGYRLERIYSDALNERDARI